jgi:uncharacterized protein (DUF2062 family)/2-polyprenyl-3-methyl-5-hydroxy-6-metoxy-1,4-benzoquinol methylase
MSQRRATRYVRDLLYKLRTEGMSPARQAWAVAVGVLIGCSPFYGLHLALCILFSRLFRLNLGLTYLAAHVSLPGVWPLLVLAELEIGRRLQGQSYASVKIADLKHLNPWEAGGDLLLGSAVVGVLLAALLGGLTYWAARRRQLHPEIAALIEEGARRYKDVGMFHWEFVRGKLRHDPLYFNLLRRGFLPPKGLLLDLGCGRGILFSLLLAARDLHAQGIYPPDWPPPSPSLTFHGIEGRLKTAEATREALSGEARIETGDLRSADLPTADAILLLDVLHYLPAPGQETLLARIAAALAPGGVLLIRDADADAGWRFTATRIQERFSSISRRNFRQRFHYRSAAEWGDLLEKLGLTVDVQPMGMGTPYANVLLAARRAPTL